jgi:preprotein translocase subunit SecB
MADETASDAAIEDPKVEAPKMPRLHVAGQYVRDLSFENAAVQKHLQTAGRPDIAVQVGTDARKRTDSDQYEVITKMTITANASSDTKDPVFMMELEYGGLFTVENVAEEQLHPFLLIEGPRMLFPFIRRIVADVTRDGGFPPLLLDNIDFVQLYRQQMAARAQQKQAVAKNGNGAAGNGAAAIGGAEPTET